MVQITNIYFNNALSKQYKIKDGDGKMAIIKSNGLDKIRKAKVKYEKKFNGQFPWEALITIHSLGGELTAIFPLSSIDEEHEVVYAVVIDEKEDSYLVDLPNHTFTSGSKAWFPRSLVSMEV